MTKRQSIPTWIAGIMLAYALMLPAASSSAAELEAQDKSEDTHVHEGEHKHSHSDSHSHMDSHSDASSHSTSHSHGDSHMHKKMSSEDIKQMRMKKMKRLAQYFGISVEGKTLDQLRAEIDQAKKEQPEKWEAFKQEFRAKKLEKMREYAKSKGIDTEGKSLQQLHDELYELKQRAE